MVIDPHEPKQQHSSANLWMLTNILQLWTESRHLCEHKNTVEAKICNNNNNIKPINKGLHSERQKLRTECLLDFYVFLR